VHKRTWGASLHHIRLTLVPFNSCWTPLPNSGRAADTESGVSQLRFGAESRGDGAGDCKSESASEVYAHWLGAFAKDDRIFACDVWNERGGDNAGRLMRI
jgi:hypothetical protein